MPSLILLGVIAIVVIIQLLMVLRFFQIADDVAKIRAKIVGSDYELAERQKIEAQNREAFQRAEAERVRASLAAEEEARKQARREQIHRRSLELNGPPPPKQ
ncbi:MAG: hypothetical protein L6R30_13865 [Thermoanaerobaculia bacterium]|nr:hypothetical protein [Thermoanaerobaculia bacterium]MCK6683490.1 hypothetical protein [Thermoanaerobaculia bacterium]